MLCIIEVVLHIFLLKYVRHLELTVARKQQSVTVSLWKKTVAINLRGWMHLWEMWRTVHNNNIYCKFILCSNFLASFVFFVFFYRTTDHSRKLLSVLLVMQMFCLLTAKVSVCLDFLKLKLTALYATICFVSHSHELKTATFCSFFLFLQQQSFCGFLSI